MDERPSPGDEPDGMIAEGVGGGPMRPDEERIYGTDETAASDADAPTPVTSTTTWLAAGLIVLAIFVALLVYAVIGAAPG